MYVCVCVGVCVCVCVWGGGGACLRACSIPRLSRFYYTTIMPTVSVYVCNYHLQAEVHLY